MEFKAPTLLTMTHASAMPNFIRTSVGPVEIMEVCIILMIYTEVKQ
jgi:hypothetical protein